MKKGRILVVIFILLLVILYVIIYVVPKMVGMLEDTTVLKYGTLPVTDSAEALIVRDETLFLAESEGRLSYKIDESSKVRKGTKLVELEPGNVVEKETDSDGKEIEPESEYKEIIVRAGKDAKVSGDNTSNISGVVSYHVDGYEKLLTPKTIKNLDGKKIEEIDGNVTNLKRKITLQGDPIYKTAKNTLWYLVIWKEKGESIKNYKDNKQVKVNIGKTQIDAKVKNIYEKEDGNLVVLETDMYYKFYSKYRKAKVSVVFAEYQGLIVEKDSIVEKDGRSEVYVKQKDESYKPVYVNVLATSGDYSVLAVKQFYDDEGMEVKTVNYYEEILTNPKDYKGKDD